jgi:hypothetical protein
MMAMTTRSSINVKARSQALSRREQEIVRLLTVPLLGTVRDAFMVSMHAKKLKGLSMNLPRPSNRSLPWKSGAEDARTPDASRLPNVSEPREAFGVRPACRRFGIARDHCSHPKKREQAPRTPNAGALCQVPPGCAKRLECVGFIGAFRPAPGQQSWSRCIRKKAAGSKASFTSPCLRVPATQRPHRRHHSGCPFFRRHRQSRGIGGHEPDK